VPKKCFPYLISPFLKGEIKKDLDSIIPLSPPFFKGKRDFFGSLRKFNRFNVVDPSGGLLLVVPDELAKAPIPPQTPYLLLTIPRHPQVG